jgi:acetyl esterase
MKVSEENMNLVKKIRERDVLLVPISKEMMQQYPAQEQEMFIKTREGETHIYFYKPLNEKPYCPLFINIHGGGFIKGRFNKDNFFSRKAVNHIGCSVIDIDYKVSPESMFPVALNECYDIVKWAYNNSEKLGIDKNKIVVCGHSAGATLTAGLTIMANQSKDFSVVLQVLDYPPMDLFTAPSEKRNPPDISPALIEKARLFNSMYIAPEESKNPLASPVYASLESLNGLPPALVITAGFDGLCDEGEKYAAMLREAGVEVVATRFINSVHGFTIGLSEGYKEAEDLIFGSSKRYLGLA